MGSELSSFNTIPDYQRIRFNFSASNETQAERFARYRDKVHESINRARTFPEVFTCSLCATQTRGFFVFPCFHAACKECYSQYRRQLNAVCPLCKKYTIANLNCNLTAFAISTLSQKQQRDYVLGFENNPPHPRPLSLHLVDSFGRSSYDQNWNAVNALRLSMMFFARKCPEVLLPLALTCSSLYRAAQSSTLWKTAVYGHYECWEGKLCEYNEKVMKSNVQTWLCKFLQKSLISPASPSLFISIPNVAYYTRDWEFFYNHQSNCLHVVNLHDENLHFDFLSGYNTTGRLFYEHIMIDINNPYSREQRITPTSPIESARSRIERRVPVPSFGFSVFGETMSVLYAFADSQTREVLVMLNGSIFSFPIRFANEPLVEKNEKYYVYRDGTRINPFKFLFPNLIRVKRSIPLISANGYNIVCNRHLSSLLPKCAVTCPVCLSCSAFGTSCATFRENATPVEMCGCGPGHNGCICCGVCLPCLKFISERTNLCSKFPNLKTHIVARTINNTKGDFAKAEIELQELNPVNAD